MRVLRSLVPFLLLLTAGLPAVAQSIDGRFGLGIEVPVLDVRHISQDISVPSGTAGATTTTAVGQTTTGLGLFSLGAGLNGQYGLSSQTVLGARLALRRETSKSDGSATAAHSQLSLLPRFEYYMAPDAPVRPHLGLEAGYERSTSNGASGVTSNLWFIGPTGGVSYFPSSDWSLDVNASLYFVTGSEEISGQSVSSSGYGGVLRVALSSWFGSKPAEPAPAPHETRQPVADAAHQDAASSGTAKVTVTRGTVQTFLAISPELTLTLTTLPVASPEKVKFKLTMDGTSDAFAGCESLAMDFGGNQIQAIQAQRQTRAGGFTAEDTLIGLLPADILDAATVQKGNSELVVCQRRWPLTSMHVERLRALKETSDAVLQGEGLAAGDSSAIEQRNDAVSTELLLSRDASLRLEAKPQMNPYFVTARFILRVGSEKPLNCSDVKIHADASEHRIEDTRPSRQSTSDGPVDVVEGHLAFTALGHIAAGTDDEVIDACGHTAKLSPSNREQTWAFTVQSVALAKRLGVWRGYRAPPTAESTAQPENKTSQPDSSKRKKK